MTSKPIELDWKRLLGFSQVNSVGRTPVLTAKVGPKDLAPSLQSKIGEKGPPPGIIGRPQELANTAR